MAATGSPLTAPASASAEACMHEIVDGLWLGSMFAAYDADALVSQRVTAVLSCAVELPVRKDVADAAGVRRGLHLPMEDRPDFADAELCMREGADAMARWLGEGHRVLCHCAAGVSRSAACVVAFLILHRGMRADAALAHVQRRRRVAQPNAGFLAVLQAMDTAAVRPLPAAFACVRSRPT